ncbi:putative excitatory amino acid transporter 1 [Dictyocaulus viviparus]|uniref:Amino acid transporter n=1 Tax=Dictyocaulus viviparus TaxID=29172 RepID=A0A0D8XFT3_DICVI|nr:putative excitatory amino acid transporter 1 [Dictyocaulus viviparus]
MDTRKSITRVNNFFRNRWCFLGFVMRPSNPTPQVFHSWKLSNADDMGSLAFIYYIATTFIAVITGIILVLSIHPGDPDIKKDIAEGTEGRNVSTLDTLLDLVRNMFPENIVTATFQQVRTKYVSARPTILQRNHSIHSDVVKNATTFKYALEYANGINVLGVIVFSIAIGISLSQLGAEADVMIQLFIVMDKIIMRLMMVVIWYSPIGIMSLITGKILEIDDMAETARMLAMYMITVLLGLTIHSFISLPFLFFFTTQSNPYKFMSGLIQALCMALGTASSSATLPLTFKCLEQNLGVDRRVTSFVLPVGATINMDGTALYEAVATIFIAQMNSIHLTTAQVVTVSLTATLASIGAASVPSAGLITMLMVLTSVGLPVNDISLIIAVDWLLDRVRTSVNVLGDAFGAGIVYYFVEEDLMENDLQAMSLSSMDGDFSSEFSSGRFSKLRNTSETSSNT